MYNEADTRAKLIDPKLHECGWTEEKIQRNITIVPGKLLDEKGKRKKGKIPDYILTYNSRPVAVVEAKDESGDFLYSKEFNLDEMDKIDWNVVIDKPYSDK